MTAKRMTVGRSNGMEARPVAMLVQLASQFESSIHIESQNRRVNAKSIMGMMALGLDSGEEITVTADGNDEAYAVEAIEQYIVSAS